MEIESSRRGLLADTLCSMLLPHHPFLLSFAKCESTGSRFVSGIYLRFTAHLCSPEWSVIVAIINLLCYSLAIATTTARVICQYFLIFSSSFLLLLPTGLRFPLLSLANGRHEASPLLR